MLCARTNSTNTIFSRGTLYEVFCNGNTEKSTLLVVFTMDITVLEDITAVLEDITGAEVAIHVAAEIATETFIS